jgi:hypothetical protein
MAFDWNEFLSLAEELAQNDDEASHRTAISRAYYAIFNLACDRAKRNCGPMPQGVGGSHVWCWLQYDRGADPDSVRLAEAGRRLKDRRVSADYKKASISRLKETALDTVIEVASLQRDLAALDPRYPTR